MKKILIVIIFSLTITSAFSLEEFKINSLKDLEACEQKYRFDTGMCFEPLKKFLEKNPKLNLEAAKKGRKIFASWAVLPFFEKALSTSKDLNLCTDEDFLLSLFNAVGQDPDSNEFKIAKKLIQEKCSTKIHDRLIKEIEKDAPTSILVETGCPVIKKAGLKTSNCEQQVKTSEVKNEPEKLLSIDKKNVKISSAKVYKGPEGSRVVLGMIEGHSDLFLIYFYGFKGPWNNKTLLHKSMVSGNNGEVDYWTEFGNQQWNSVITKNCYSGYCQLAVFLPESGFRDGIEIFYSEKETKEYQVQDLLKTF